MNFVRQGFQKLSSDRQTESTKIIKHVALWELNNSQFVLQLHKEWLAKAIIVSCM